MEERDKVERPRALLGTGTAGLPGDCDQLRGDDMSGAGQAEVNTKLMPALDKVASAIDKVEGKVQVIGHSHNQPIKGARFPSNQALSEERAAMVSEDLAGNGANVPRTGAWKWW
ncbi:hypothetical protein CNECB9_1490004 [Cupriavidus necator]|uniref:OmpA-like domain-containing protein n=2 Tax=Cupriavidus necator TaxID=106590 RepID=A0A1K0JFE8_CUPNE|nr:hypothetical protein CNECB9_1490004 [Cupriavidus necator]